MKNQIMAKVNRMKKAYGPVVITAMQSTSDCKCGQRKVIAAPVVHSVTCTKEELESVLDSIQNINEFDASVSLSTLFITMTVIGTHVCDACKPKHVDLSSVITTAKNGTKEYPVIVVMAPIADKTVRCQIKDLRRSEGLYTGKLNFFRKVEDNHVMITLDFQWNPKKHDVPLVKMGGKIIEESKRKMYQDLVKSAFDAYGAELVKMAEAKQAETPAQKPHNEEVIETEHTHRCDDIDESQYFNN